MAHSRSFLANQKARNAIVGAENLLGCYNIVSRAAQSNSVYVSVLQISIVHSDCVSKSLCQNFFFARAAIVRVGKNIQIFRDNNDNNNNTLFFIHSCTAYIHLKMEKRTKLTYNYWVWGLINLEVFELAPSYFELPITKDG